MDNEHAAKIPKAAKDSARQRPRSVLPNISDEPAPAIADPNLDEEARASDWAMDVADDAMGDEDLADIFGDFDNYDDSMFDDPPAAENSMVDALRIAGVTESKAKDAAASMMSSAPPRHR